MGKFPFWLAKMTHKFFFLGKNSSSNESASKLAYSHAKIEEILQCPLCLERLYDPRALPCQHVLCCGCLQLLAPSNSPFLTITCPLCRHIFPYNNINQFPKSYVHSQLLDLVPFNCDTNGKCFKCKEKHVLHVCPCCEYLICKKCLKNDRENMLINIRNLIQMCHKYLECMPPTQVLFNSLELNHISWSNLNELLRNADLLLDKSETIEFNDILSFFSKLNIIHQQLEQTNKLPTTILKRTYENEENDDDENIKIVKHIRIEPPISLNESEQIDDDDDDDDIYYIETKQIQSTTISDERLETLLTDK